MRFLLPTPERRRAALRAVSRAATRALGGAAVAVALSACSFITGVPDVSRVDFDVPVKVIAPGQSVQATALPIGGGGSAIDHPRRRVGFSSSNDSIATVAANGVITGVAPGRATITASVDGKSSRIEITVRPVPVKQVLIAPRAPVVRLVPGVASILGAAVLDTLGAPLANRPPTWVSLDPGVATINSIGAVTPVALGTARVTAAVDTGLAPALGRVVDTVTLRVTPTPIVRVRITPTNPVVYSGQKLTLTATVTDSLLTTVTRRVVWSASDRGTVIALDSLTGEATAVASSAVSTNVTATVETVQGFPGTDTRTDVTLLTVLPPAASVRVSNGAGAVSALALRSGAVSALTLSAVDALGNVLSGRIFRLTSSNPAVASVSDAPVPSSTTITAGATAGTATITVQTLNVREEPQGTSTTFTVTVTP
jgi:uncharacterized protein YjdB